MSTRSKTPILDVLSLLLVTFGLLACSASNSGPTPQQTPTVSATAEPTQQTEAPASDSGKKITKDNAGKLRQMFLVPVSKTALMAASVSAANHQIATFGFDKVVRIFDGDTGDQKKELYGNSEYGRALGFSPDGTRLASGGAYYVWLWDAKTGQKIATTQVNTAILRLAWSPDGNTIAVVGQRSASIQLLDGKTGRMTNQLLNPTNYAMLAISYAPDGKAIGVGDGRGWVTVFDPKTNQVLFDDHSRPRGAVSAVSFSPDGRYFGSCHLSTGDIEIWQTSDWSQVMTKEQAHDGGCIDSTFSSDGEVYFTVGHDGKFNAWNVQTGELMNTIQEAQAVWSVSLSGDGELLAVAVDTGRMGIISVP